MRWNRLSRLSALAAAAVLSLSLALPAAAAEASEPLLAPVREAPAFSDTADTGYQEEIAAACAAGLMEPRSDGSFAPEAELMPEELVAACDRLCHALTDGDLTLPAPAEGEAWYVPYYRDLASHIDYRGEYDPTTRTWLGGGDGAQTPEERYDVLRWNFHAAKYPVRRYRLAQLLTLTLEAAGTELPAINHLTATADCRDSAEMALYRAGVLTGVDAWGAFDENRTVTRGELAAVLGRIADPSLRRRFTVKDFDLCAEVLGLEADTQAIAIEYGDIAHELSAEVAADALCQALEIQQSRQESGAGTDLTQVVPQAVDTLKEDLALEVLARSLGVSVSEEEAQARAGAAEGYRGLTQAGLAWKTYHELLWQRVLDHYFDHPAQGEALSAPDAMYRDLEALKEEMTAHIAPQLQEMDWASALARLEASPLG